MAYLVDNQKNDNGIDTSNKQFEEIFGEPFYEPTDWCKKKQITNTRYKALKLAVELFKGSFANKAAAEKSDIEELFIAANINLKYLNDEEIDYSELVAPADVKREINKRLSSFKSR